MAEYPALARTLSEFGTGVSNIIQERLWQKEYEDFKSGPLAVYQSGINEASRLVNENPDDPDIGAKSWQVYKKASIDLMNASVQWRNNPIVSQAVQSIYEFNANLPQQLLQQRDQFEKRTRDEQIHKSTLETQAAQREQAYAGAAADRARAGLYGRQAAELGGGVGGYSRQVPLPSYIFEVQNPQTKEQIVNKQSKVDAISRRERTKLFQAMQGKKNPLNGMPFGEDKEADTLYIDSQLNPEAIKQEAERQIVTEDAAIRGWRVDDPQFMASTFGMLGFKTKDEVTEGVAPAGRAVGSRVLPAVNAAHLLGEVTPGQGDTWLELPEKGKGEIVTSREVKEALPVHYAELLQQESFLATPLGWAMTTWQDGLVDPLTGEPFGNFKEFKAYYKELIEDWIQKTYNRPDMSVTKENEKSQRNRSIYNSRQQARAFMIEGGDSFLERYSGQLAREHGLPGAPEEWKGFGELLWEGMKMHPAYREGGAALEDILELLHLKRPEDVPPPSK